MEGSIAIAAEFGSGIKSNHSELAYTNSSHAEIVDLVSDRAKVNRPKSIYMHVKMRLRPIGSGAAIGDESRAFYQRRGRGSERTEHRFRLGNEML